MGERPTASQPEELRDFPEFVNGLLADWKAPGMAVAVAKDGEIILSQGFGLRDIGRDLPVTPNTLFAIGSATKAFTTMCLGLLADEGKVDWDTPVKTYLPAFKLHDPFASDRITPRDLVTHRSGLPRHDLMWYGADFPRQEIVERLQYLVPNKDFRTDWQYQNLMYLTAGYLAGVIAGQEWEDLVRGRIFTPLGMNHSNLSVTISQSAEDFARPYQEKDGKAEELPFRVIDAVGPAGAINSCVADMGDWLLLHLNNGRHQGEQFVSERQISQMHAPQMVMPSAERFPELSLPSYGLGWFVSSYRGHTLVEHGGNIDGFSALVSMMPREQIGVVVLTNLNGAPLPNLAAYHVYDRLLGLDEVPWNERFLKMKADQHAAGDKSKEQSVAEQIAGTSPSHPLDAYVGEYANPGYGVTTIDKPGDELTLSYHAFNGPLRHYHYDTFEYTFELFDQRALLTFTTNAKGDIASVSAPLEPTVSDIVFTRQPAAAMTETAFLSQFVGSYELMEMTLRVSPKGPHALQVSLPGQPEYELEPYKGTAFRLRGLSEFSIEFTLDDSGAVTGGTLTQPGAVFPIRKVA